MGKPNVYTVGHSNHALAFFLNLLKENRIDVVADVRSYPYSKYVPHFNLKPLAATLSKEGLQYSYLGRQLGGKPEGEDFYDNRGELIYGMVSVCALFLSGMEWVKEQVLAHRRLVLLCGEENPLHCHRRILLGRYLMEEGIPILHIRGNGEIQNEEDLRLQAKQAREKDLEPWLFEWPDDLLSLTPASR